MAFQILRPRLHAELDRVKMEEKAAVQKRLAAEKEALSQRTASPTKDVSPALPSPKSASMQLDGDESGDVVMEDGKEVVPNGTALSIPPPKNANVSVTALLLSLLNEMDVRRGKRLGGRLHSP